MTTRDEILANFVRDEVWKRVPDPRGEDPYEVFTVLSRDVLRWITMPSPAREYYTQRYKQVMRSNGYEDFLQSEWTAHAGVDTPYPDDLITIKRSQKIPLTRLLPCMTSLPVIQKLVKMLQRKIGVYATKIVSEMLDAMGVSTHKISLNGGAKGWIYSIELKGCIPISLEFNQSIRTLKSRIRLPISCTPIEKYEWDTQQIPESAFDREKEVLNCLIPIGYAPFTVIQLIVVGLPWIDSTRAALFGDIIPETNTEQESIGSPIFTSRKVKVITDVYPPNKIMAMCDGNGFITWLDGWCLEDNIRDTRIVYTENGEVQFEESISA